MLERQHTDGGTSGPNFAWFESPAKAADEAISYALDFSRSRLSYGADPLPLLKRDDAAAHDYFREGLAFSIASYIGEVDAQVKSILLCSWDESTEDCEEGPTTIASPLSLILWVERKTGALDSLLADLDTALLERYREMVWPAAANLDRLLDAHVVDDYEVNARIDCGVLFTSLYHRPTRVWSRAAA